MPNVNFGMSGAEIVTFVQNWIGNTSTSMQSFLINTLPMAEMRYCKLHDWSFLSKVGLKLTVSSGTSIYDTSALLDSTNAPFNVAAKDIGQIYSKDHALVLKRLEPEDIRRADPASTFGTNESYIRAWSVQGGTTIEVWPSKFSDTTLFIDAKISVVPLLTLSNYPTIPYKYQEGFINYLISLALMRENDDRFQVQKADTLQMIRADIADDAGNSDMLPRMRSMNEQRFDGVGTNLESLFNSWVWGTFN